MTIGIAERIESFFLIFSSDNKINYVSCFVRSGVSEPTTHEARQFPSAHPANWLIYELTNFYASIHQGCKQISPIVL